ncbi:hypothetical protein BN1263170328 [Stenotrophomonas maltophilia]|nr:hypothetical protein BN1263170328 [Stenotrophomonas maltophilia]
MLLRRCCDEAQISLAMFEILAAQGSW